jgi:O-antigen/teichoic acid export membrane protein
MPARCLDPPAVRALLRVGMPLTASTLVLIARYRLFAILIGTCAGPAVLGQVHLAFRLVDTVRELASTALWRLMLPRLSARQHDPWTMLAEVDRWARWCAATFLPLCAVMAIGLTPAVTLFMGDAWAEAGRATKPLLVLMAWSALTFPGGVALVAVGRVRLALYANLASLLAGCAGVLLVPPASAMQAAVIWTVGQLMVTPYCLWANARALGVGLLRPLTGGFGLRCRA